MNLRGKIVFSCFLVVSLLYLGVGWYFSNIILDFNTKTLAQDKKNLNITDHRQFNLPDPVDISVQNGAITLKGWLFKRTSRCGVIISHGHTGTRYGGLKYAPLFEKRACSIIVFDARPDIAFVAADAPFHDLKTILIEQGEKQYGPVIKLFIPIVEILANLRSGANLEKISPSLFAARIKIPVFLNHSLQDTYTPPHHSRKIARNIKHGKHVLHLTNRGATRGKTLDKNPTGYQKQIDEFPNTYVPHFGVARTP